MDEKTKKLLDIKPSDIWKTSTGGPGNPFIFSYLDLLMNRISREYAVEKYYMLLHSGKIILQDAWDCGSSRWHKKLIQYENDIYIAILQGREVYSVEKVDSKDPIDIYVEYELASKLKGDGIDGDAIYDVRTERERQDYLREILRKNEFNPLCKS